MEKSQLESTCPAHSQGAPRAEPAPYVVIAPHSVMAAPHSAMAAPHAKRRLITRTQRQAGRNTHPQTARLLGLADLLLHARPMQRRRADADGPSARINMCAGRLSVAQRASNEREPGAFRSGPSARPPACQHAAAPHWQRRDGRCGRCGSAASVVDGGHRAGGGCPCWRRHVGRHGAPARAGGAALARLVRAARPFGVRGPRLPRGTDRR